MLTDIGRAKMIAAVALGQTLEFSTMAVGDGDGAPITPDPAMTALVGERYGANINTLTQDPDNPNYLTVEMVVPTSVGGWTIHEVGVFDNLGALVVIASFPATYKPIVTEGSARELVVRGGDGPHRRGGAGHRPAHRAGHAQLRGGAHSLGRGSWRAGATG